jgi:branched-chain amino acid transport system substrate-binding protein
MRLRKAIGMMCLFALLPGLAVAQSNASTDGAVKIGVLGDFSGMYSGMSGKGAIEAVKMAVEDFGGSVLGKKIEIVTADHQNRPDIAATTARKWFDTDAVDMITDLAGSASALAVVDVARQKNRIAIVNSAAASDVWGLKCTPNSILYTIDTTAVANATANALMKRGLDSWFFVAADYVFGKSMERDVSEVVNRGGGKVVGTVRHPLGATDFSSFLLQAQASKAKVIALANAGNDVANSLKSAKEFGLGKDGKQTIVGLMILIDVIHSLGLETAQKLTLATPFYWDADEMSRKFSKRFFERVGKMPSMTHAGTYSSTLHYLAAVEAVGSDNTPDVMKKMKATPVNDFFSKGGRIREDGLYVHDMMLVQVKTPAESKGPWDYYKIIQKIPAADVYKPISESPCPLVQGKQ